MKNDNQKLLDDEQIINEEDELTLDDLQGNWIKNPEVGNEIEFEVKKVVKSKNVKATTREGKEFSRALSKMDYAVEIHTATNAIYTISSWEVFGKIKAIFRKNGQIAGTQIKIRHVLDGMKNKNGNNYDVLTNNNGTWQRLNKTTNNWETPK